MLLQLSAGSGYLKLVKKNTALTKSYGKQDYSYKLDNYLQIAWQRSENFPGKSS